MYNPHIQEGNKMFADLVNKHADELYFAEYFFEKIKYDDGFVAYLNGVQIAQENAPAPVTWDSVATASHRNSEAVEFVDFDVSISKSSVSVIFTISI